VNARRLPFLFAVAFALIPATGFAATAINLGKHNADAPIQVSADSFIADINAKSGTYAGNVVVTQGDFKLRADKVRINVVGSKPSRIVADGHVVFDSPSGTAHGDTGVYEVGPRLITLSGRVLLTKDKNVMRGTALTVNLVTGAAQLRAKGEQGGRVQGLFTPPPRSAPSKNQSNPQTNP
jgi:lipopolysaccharide export system protein LptA